MGLALTLKWSVALRALLVAVLLLAPRTGSAESLLAELTGCVVQDSEPALLGYCHDGVLIAPVHLTPYQTIGKAFYGLAQVGAYVETNYAATALQLTGHAENQRLVALSQVSLVDRSDEVWSLVQLAPVALTREFRGGIQVGAVLYGRFRGIARIGLFNWSERFLGVIQLGAFNFAEKHRAGVQIGVLNTGARVHGLGQWGVANFAGQRFTGVTQIGVFNYATRAAGLQIGLVNVARNLRGIQLGLVNIAFENGLLPLMVGVNVAWTDRYDPGEEYAAR